MKRNRLALALVTMVGVGLNTMVYASGTSSQQMQSSNCGNPNAGNPIAASGNNSDNNSVIDQVTSLYNQGLDAVKSNYYAKAVGLFQQALDLDANNADVLNQLPMPSAKPANWMTLLRITGRP